MMNDFGTLFIYFHLQQKQQFEAFITFRTTLLRTYNQNIDQIKDIAHAKC